MENREYLLMEMRKQEQEKREMQARMADKAFGRLFQQVMDVKMGNYDANSQYLLTIKNVYREDWFSAYAFMFQYGFLKGQRCEKARQKRKRGSEV